MGEHELETPECPEGDSSRKDGRQECLRCPPCGRAAIQPAQWAGLAMLRPHSPTVRAGPTPYTGWARLQGGQRSVSLEYQTCTSAYLFDTLVTGKVPTSGEFSHLSYN